MIFRGYGPVLLYFCDFSGVGRTSCPHPLWIRACGEPRTSDPSTHRSQVEHSNQCAHHIDKQYRSRYDVYICSMPNHIRAYTLFLHKRHKLFHTSYLSHSCEELVPIRDICSKIKCDICVRSIFTIWVEAV